MYRWQPAPNHVDLYRPKLCIFGLEGPKRFFRNRKSTPPITIPASNAARAKAPVNPIAWRSTSATDVCCDGASGTRIIIGVVD